MSGRTLADVDLPTHDDWSFEYEGDTQVHWRRSVTAEELAADSDAHTAEDYEDGIPEHYKGYEVTLRQSHSGDGWGVSFAVPSLQRGGLGDTDPNLSLSDVSLDEAVDHVRSVLSEKSASE